LDPFEPESLKVIHYVQGRKASDTDSVPSRSVGHSTFVNLLVYYTQTSFGFVEIPIDPALQQQSQATP
jgi:hypothetical protein